MGCEEKCTCTTGWIEDLQAARLRLVFEKTLERARCEERRQDLRRVEDPCLFPLAKTGFEDVPEQILIDLHVARCHPRGNLGETRRIVAELFEDLRVSLGAGHGHSSIRAVARLTQRAR